MKFDLDRCAECGKLLIEPFKPGLIPTAYASDSSKSGYDLDSEGRIDPSDPFSFCSDECFENALANLHDFGATLGWSREHEQISKRVSAAAWAAREAIYGTAKDWYARHPILVDGKMIQHDFPDLSFDEKQRFEPTAELAAATERQKERYKQHLEEAKQRYRQRWYAERDHAEKLKQCLAEANEQSRIEAIKKR